jgi:hypothetical protein
MGSESSWRASRKRADWAKVGSATGVLDALIAAAKAASCSGCEALEKLHVKLICRKLGASNRTQAAMIARERALC